MRFGQAGYNEISLAINCRNTRAIEQEGEPTQGVEWDA